MGLTRSFIAIPILGREAAVLARAGRALRAGRPVAEENLHLTLAFLGDLGAEALGEVDAALSGLRAAPVDLRFGGPGAPGGGAAPLVWCEVAPDPNGSEWDANVGARLLYRLCGCLLRSQGLC